MAARQHSLNTQLNCHLSHRWSRNQFCSNTRENRITQTAAAFWISGWSLFHHFFKSRLVWKTMSCFVTVIQDTVLIQVVAQYCTLIKNTHKNTNMYTDLEGSEYLF